MEAQAEEYERYPQHQLTSQATAVDDIDSAPLAGNIAHWTQQRALLTSYIRQHLQEGIDYYTIILGNKVAKPSLSKAGSEKFLSLFNLQARFHKDAETWEMLGCPAGVLCYVCVLAAQDGTVVGEGRGARDIAQDNDINKAIKMAQKSAQIDAILRIGALSDSFTQDLEDQHPPEPDAVRQQKRRIVALLRQLGQDPVDKTGYAEAVQQYTALALLPECYAEIIRRLEECLQAQGSSQEGRLQPSQ